MYVCMYKEPKTNEVKKRKKTIKKMRETRKIWIKKKNKKLMISQSEVGWEINRMLHKNEK